MEKERGRRSVRINQRVAVLIDGNNIEKSVHQKYNDTGLHVDYIGLVKDMVRERDLVKVAYFREGKGISPKFSDRLAREFYGTTTSCYKGADIPLVLQAVKLVEKVDTIILFAGDADYVWLVDYLNHHGVRVEIVSVNIALSKVLGEKSQSIFYIGLQHCFKLVDSDGPNNSSFEED